MNYKHLIKGNQYIINPQGKVVTYIGAYFVDDGEVEAWHTFRTKDGYHFEYTKKEVLDRIFDIVEETSKSISQILN